MTRHPFPRYIVRIPGEPEYTTNNLFQTRDLPDDTTITEIDPDGKRYRVPVKDGRAVLWAREELQDV